MLIKSLKLYNFRQFIDEEVKFATNENKNVTIIIGENGSGKTTFSQAFFWCFYGDVAFKDKNMINKIVADNLMPKDNGKVKVCIELTHAGIDYTITRDQEYTKDYSGKLRANQSNLNIQYTKDGVQEFLKPLKVYPRIKEILPQELSKYFFFDGERIEKMSKEIQNGRKSTEFAEAVKGLLGLSALISALDHLNPTSAKSVLGSYNKDYDYSCNENMARYEKKIKEHQSDIDMLNNRIEEINNEINLRENRKTELKDNINRHEDGQRLQNEKCKFIIEKNNMLESKRLTTENLLACFREKSCHFFSNVLISKAAKLLEEGDYINKDIPDMYASTIDFLVEKKECLCGTPLIEGSKEYKHIKNLLKYLPPESIGITVGHFIKESKLRYKNLEDLYISYESLLKVFENQQANLIKIDDHISEIEENLKDYKDIAPLETELEYCIKVIKELGKEKETKIEERGKITTKRDRVNTERATLSLRDVHNMKIETYKAYAMEVYNKLNSIFMDHEKVVRRKLEKNMNDLFNKIYRGGLTLEIDEKYNISVFVDENDKYTNIETSTAQSISIIFAFITGIIKMAREDNQIASNQVRLESEPYPLVMDAPLSSFDKRRIKSVCETIPEVAEQVIVFIKDTDGDIAQKYLCNKIGEKYRLNKLNELETTVHKEEFNV